MADRDEARTILHIGPPKTGTTTLQEQVFPELGSVCFLGKRWWSPDVPYDKCVALHRAIDSVSKCRPEDYDADAAHRAVHEWLRHSPRAAPLPDGGFLPRFLSEERLAVSDVVGLPVIAERLAKLFPGAEIVYVRRDPIAGLRSYHRWLYARAWIDQGFSEWLSDGFEGREDTYAAVALRSYDWTLLEASFGRHFPLVRSVEFAEMSGDPSGFLARLLGLEAAEFADFAWLRDRPLNVSPGRGASELHRAAKKSIRLWNRLPFGKIDEKPEYIGDTGLWRGLERLASALPLSDAKLSATEADRARILSYYSKGRERSLGP